MDGAELNVSRRQIQRHMNKKQRICCEMRKSCLMSVIFFWGVYQAQQASSLEILAYTRMASALRRWGGNLHSAHVSVYMIVCFCCEFWGGHRLVFCWLLYRTLHSWIVCTKWRAIECKAFSLSLFSHSLYALASMWWMIPLGHWTAISQPVLRHLSSDLTLNVRIAYNLYSIDTYLPFGGWLGHDVVEVRLYIFYCRYSFISSFVFFFLLLPHSYWTE